jgi:hypothetical protein
MESFFSSLKTERTARKAGVNRTGRSSTTALYVTKLMSNCRIVIRYRSLVAGPDAKSAVAPVS